MSRFVFSTRLSTSAQTVSHTWPCLTARIGQRVWSYPDDVTILLMEGRDPTGGVSSKDGVRIRQAACCAIPWARIAAKWMEKDVVCRLANNASDDLKGCQRSLINLEHWASDQA
jgi:hypothetical protein